MLESSRQRLAEIKKIISDKNYHHLTIEDIAALAWQGGETAKETYVNLVYATKIAAHYYLACYPKPVKHYFWTSCMQQEVAVNIIYVTEPLLKSLESKERLAEEKDIKVYLEWLFEVKNNLKPDELYQGLLSIFYVGITYLVNYYDVAILPSEFYENNEVWADNCLAEIDNFLASDQEIEMTTFKYAG